MIPQYQFNLGMSDPLLNPNMQPTDFANELDNRIAEMQMMKKQLIEDNQFPQQRVAANNTSSRTKQITIIDEINNEISALTKSQKETLFNDEEYANNDYVIQMIIQQELVNMVKGKLETIPDAKELLDKQLKFIKDRKNKIVEDSDKEIELFKKFQIAAQANPNLSYAEFVKSINK